VTSEQQRHEILLLAGEYPADFFFSNLKNIDSSAEKVVLSKGGQAYFIFKILFE